MEKEFWFSARIGDPARLVYRNRKINDALPD
jgi:hypothetical protein